jgi:hypothetical protein
MNDRFGVRSIYQNELSADDLNADKLSGLEVKLHTHFFADVAVIFRIELDFRRIENGSLRGKMIRNTRGAGGLPTGMMIRKFGDWPEINGKGGCRDFVVRDLAGKDEFELGRVNFLTGFTEDPAANGVYFLPKEEDFGSLARDDLIALGDLV